MKNYLRWSLHQLFWIYFQPSRFGREVEGGEHDQPKLAWRDRSHYLLKMLPWIAAFSIAGNLLAGRLCELFGVHYLWLRSGEGVALGVALGIASGMARGVAL